MNDLCKENKRAS